MSPSLCILGRQPALGLVELESLYSGEKVQPVGANAALLDVEPKLVDFSRLGGTMKFAKVLTVLETTKWSEIQSFLETSVPKHAAMLPAGKLRIGLSVYGLEVRPTQIMATALMLKKAVRTSGRSVRIVPNTEIALNSAQVLHNQLTAALGWELLFIRDGQQTIVAQSIAVQDIDAYTLRDRGRPKRDARVGMLPPKLAQIIINLAGKHVLSSTGLPPTEEQKENSRSIHLGSAMLLDPFCGTGVILQEAALLGYGIYGTDIEPRMIDYSRQNLEWLERTFQITNFLVRLEPGDATNQKWQQPIDLIASEAYLGRPFTTPPRSEVLAQTIADCNLIIKKFLKNIGEQIPTGTRLCLALPAWQTRPREFKHLPVLDQISDLGYNRVSFVHAKGDDLIYHREGQIVGRELLTIVRK